MRPCRTSPNNLHIPLLGKHLSPILFSVNLSLQEGTTIHNATKPQVTGHEDLTSHPFFTQSYVKLVFWRIQFYKNGITMS